VPAIEYEKISRSLAFNNLYAAPSTVNHLQFKEMANPIDNKSSTFGIQVRISTKRCEDSI